MRQFSKKLLAEATKLYLIKCTNEPPYIKGKGCSPAYWRVYKFLEKRSDHTEIKSLVDYLSDKSGRVIESIGEAFQRSEDYRKQRIMKAERMMKDAIPKDHKPMYDISTFLTS